MKSLTLAMAIAIISHVSEATPVALAGLPSLNKTLADWGIIQVPDFGLPLAAEVRDVSDGLDKRDFLAYTFQAFTGDHCDGNAGTRKDYYASEYGTSPTHCDNTAGRHSFRITSGPAYVSADPDLNCPRHDYNVPGGLAYAGCYNVNTGLNWQSSYTYYAPQ